MKCRIAMKSGTTRIVDGAIRNKFAETFLEIREPESANAKPLKGAA